MLDFSSLLTVRVEPPLKMDSRKRKWKNEEERLAMIKELQEAKVRLNEKSKAFEMEERKKLMALDKVLQDLIAKEEKVEEKKKQTERTLSKKQKVVQVKSKGKEELEKRERLRLQLTQLEKEEEEEKDKIQFEFQIQFESERKRILEQEIKIKQVESSMKENADKMDALIKEKVEFEEQIKEAKKEITEASKQRNKADALTTEALQKMTLIQKQLKTVRKDLHSAGGGEQVGDLEGFMDGQILELEAELSCPVCFEIAKTAPIYKCSDEHLVCR